MANLIVGDVVQLSRPCLSNPAGVRAVIVEVYDLDQRGGWHLLFPNGLSDGFSPNDLEAWGVLYVRHEPTIARYQFRNVIALLNDFRRGLFANAWPTQKAAADA